MGVFEKYSELYNLLYSDKDYSKEVEYILKKLKQFNCKSKNILEYGSGTCIHGGLLVEKGYNLTGVELSEKMFLIGKSHIKERKIEDRFNLVNDNIVAYWDQKKYGLILSLFHVISYLTSNEGLCKVFENASNQLEQGGLFIFDVWYAPSVLNLKPQAKIKTFENNELKIIRFTKPLVNYNENVVDVNFELVIIDKKTNQVSFLDETHKMRYLSLPEIKLLAELNSFELVKAEEFLSENEPSENTWGVCFILRKK